MPEKWTGGAIGRMHMLKISNKTLAKELGWTEEYVSMVLNGKRCPKGAESKICAAITRIEKALDVQLQS